MYLSFDPEPPLDSFVSCYWMISADRPSEALLEEVIVPDSNSDLIFCLQGSRARSAQETEKESSAVPLSTCLDVARTRPVRLQLVGPVDVIGVRFRFSGLSAFLPTTLSELAGEAVDVADVFGREASVLEERLAETHHPEERIALLDEFLVSQLSPRPQHRLIRRILEAFHRPGRTKTLPGLADDLGCSVRTVRRAFRHLVGHSPKTCERLLRFRGACRSMRSGLSRTHAEVAYQWGYYDQSHFIREFRQFTGMTPTAYRTWMQRRIAADQSGWGGAMTPDQYKSWLSRKAFMHEEPGRNIQSPEGREA